MEARLGLLALAAWIAVELFMAGLMSGSGPEFHSITTLELSTPETVDGRQLTVDSTMDKADSR